MGRPTDRWVRKVKETWVRTSCAVYFWVLKAWVCLHCASDYSGFFLKGQGKLDFPLNIPSKMLSVSGQPGFGSLNSPKRECLKSEQMLCCTIKFISASGHDWLGLQASGSSTPSVISQPVAIFHHSLHLLSSWPDHSMPPHLLHLYSLNYSVPLTSLGFGSRFCV